jgi:hypothetical protein
MGLTTDNFSQGFLVDEELMAGVTTSPENPSEFFGYVLRHTTGEYLGYQAYSSLDEALGVINQIPRPWVFEKTSGCDGGKCAEGKCKGEGCKVFDKSAAAIKKAEKPSF